MPELIQVRVMPNAGRNRVEKVSTGYRVYLSAPPVEGKANKKLIEVLADYFRCRKSQVRIVRGEKSRDKIIEVT